MVICKVITIKEEIWIEKYRPKRLDEIIGQDLVIERLKAYVNSKDMPHLLFSGLPGVGKTASAIALARELYGEDWIYNFTELNASDDRGIDVVRDKIKNFAKVSPIGQSEFKIIFLDEADALTNDAQSALRRTMEIFHKNCRFIISCNYPSKIIEPIQSRCVVYRFKPLSKEATKEVIKKIIDKEKIDVKDDAIDAIFEISEGDMRKAINVLQSAASLKKEINSEIIYAVEGSIKLDDIKKIFHLVLNGSFDQAREYLHQILDEGVSAEEIIKGIHKGIHDLDIPIDKQLKIIDRLGETDFRITEGSNERIQLDALLAYMFLEL